MRETNSNQIVFILVISLLLFVPNIGFADFWTNSECVEASGIFLNHNQLDVVEYYIENDFAQELKSCQAMSGITYNDTLTEFQARQYIQESAELWNAETRSGAVFRYKGLWNGDEATLNCDTSKVRLFIHFQEGCSVNSTGQCESAANHPLGSFKEQGSCAYNFIILTGA